MRRQGLEPPVLFEFTSYHDQGGRRVVGHFLPAITEVVTFELNSDQRQLKQELFDCFESQRRVLSEFPLDAERFRLAPAYDFTAAPHPGTLHYENFNWGMSGDLFRSHAYETLLSLGIRE